MYIDSESLKIALGRLYGTAGHLLKIWLTLKHMGLKVSGPAVEIDTANSAPSLQRLFSFGAPDGSFYIPFAHTPRYLTMKHDASRSIVQTTVQRWATSGSVVTCDPTDFLEITTNDDKLQVTPGRRYPFGLGYGRSGFALEDGARASIPINSFSIWYGRNTQIPQGEDPTNYLVTTMLSELNITAPERAVIFVDDDLIAKTQQQPLDDHQIFALCQSFIDGNGVPSEVVHQEEYVAYTRRVKSMVSEIGLPAWMKTNPKEEVQSHLDSGAKAILLYGPPRTGKTRLVDSIISRAAESRCTIQIHDGWGYDHLVEGFKPDDQGKWDWTAGPLKKAIADGKKYIVLEEVNRTAISQALGEVFSLIEEKYRGEANGIVLRSGKKFWIPADVIFLMTMNNVDKSTEDVDDALLGRVTAVELRPRVEDLSEMLTAAGVSEPNREKISRLFAEILNAYPLGHGYFAGLSGTLSNKQILGYYKGKIRPVLNNFLGELKQQELIKIDNLVDELFSKP